MVENPDIQACEAAAAAKWCDKCGLGTGVGEALIRLLLFAFLRVLVFIHAYVCNRLCITIIRQACALLHICTRTHVSSDLLQVICQRHVSTLWCLCCVQMYQEMLLIASVYRICPCPSCILYTWATWAYSAHFRAHLISCVPNLAKLVLHHFRVFLCLHVCGTLYSRRPQKMPESDYAKLLQIRCQASGAVFRESTLFCPWGWAEPISHMHRRTRSKIFLRYGCV